MVCVLWHCVVIKATLPVVLAQIVAFAQIRSGYSLCMTATTQLGEWLFRDLHGVSENVSDLTRTALLIMCAYPLFEAVVS